MTEPLYPPEPENLRAEVLGHLKILDTPPEERFDRICRLAQGALHAPATYISLLDRERQWFKSTCGMGDVKETPREGTFCDYAIQLSRPTVILNATEDALFAKSPYVVDGPRVRFYAGFPLTVRGQRVGTLCALDFEPREQVTAKEMEQFYDLARIAEAELERGLGDNAAAPPAGGDRRVVTVLKTRLGHSPELFESLPAQVVVSILNLYLERMMEVVERWKGTLDQVSGDSLCVLFGVPQVREDQALMAAGCAVDMQRTIQGINRSLQEQGLPPLACGIGLHMGEVVAGEMGSPGQWKCTVVGSAVAVTERILAHTVAGQILASESLTLALGELAWVDGKLRVTIPGLDPLTLYELGGVGELQVRVR